MQIFYIFLRLIFGVLLGLVIGVIVTLVMIAQGYGMASYVAGSVIWSVISLLGFIIGLFLYAR